MLPQWATPRMKKTAAAAPAAAPAAATSVSEEYCLTLNNNFRLMETAQRMQ